MRTTWARVRAAHDRGVTLAEMMVVIVLLGIIGAIIADTLNGSTKVYRATDDQSQGLQDVRVASERVVRDVRDARSVLCNPAGTDATLAAADPTCQFHLQLWIDFNSDYKQQADETVTWRLQKGSDGQHFNLLRQVGSHTAVVEAHTVVQQVAFKYDYPPSTSAPAAGSMHTSRVDLDMTYNSLTRTGVSSKTITESARLRNVE